MIFIFKFEGDLQPCTVNHNPIFNGYEVMIFIFKFEGDLQPCTVFGHKDFCGSTVLGVPESVGIKGQIDWQAQHLSHLVCSYARQRCSEAWGTFWTWTGQSIAALIDRKKEEWRKEAADIPPSKVKKDLCSTRQTLALFPGRLLWEGQSAYGPFWGLQCHLELKIPTWSDVREFHPKVLLGSSHPGVM